MHEDGDALIEVGLRIEQGLDGLGENVVVDALELAVDLEYLFVVLVFVVDGNDN